MQHGLKVLRAGFMAAMAFSWAGAEIVGGKSVSITQAPWQLWIGNCGATWVGGRNVITAQHCVNSASAGNMSVYHGITRRNQATQANRVGVAQIIKIATSTDLSRDIAILKLSADIPATSLARPIRYATAADATAGYTNQGVACMATGWGKLSPDLPLADSLQQVFSKIYNTPTNPSGVIRWAGQGGTTHVGSCQGDSGGPLVVKDGSGNWILAGASSYIQSFCGDPNSPSSYSRVSAFTSFLVDNGVTQPNVTPIDSRIQPLIQAGYFTLDRPQSVVVSILNLNGAAVKNSTQFYGAGQHALPTEGISSGSYILRLRGEGIDAWHRIQAGR